MLPLACPAVDGDGKKAKARHELLLRHSVRCETLGLKLLNLRVRPNRGLRERWVALPPSAGPLRVSRQASQAASAPQLAARSVFSGTTQVRPHIDELLGVRFVECLRSVLTK